MNHNVCYIIGAGEDYGLDFAVRAGDLVIAADGGLERLRAAGISPCLVIGDFDSLGRIPQEENALVLPTVKDVTDTWAAIELGKEQGHDRFWLYGCTGGRFDHTLANIQTLAALAAEGMQGFLVDRTQIITAVGPGTVEFGPERTGFLSVFAHTERCAGVSLKGLKYELNNAELTNRFPLGVSNEFQGISASVTIAEGIAVLVYER